MQWNIFHSKQLKEKEKKDTWFQIIPLILGLASFTLSLFFLNEKLTGNIIATPNQTALNYIGGLFFLIALISFSFYFFKKKKQLEKTKPSKK